jgi:hypothetical protein
VRDPKARRLSNPEVATQYPARTERSFFKHRANCFTKIIRQGSSGPGIVKLVRSPLVKASPPLLHCRSGERFWAKHQFKFDVDRSGLQPFERGEMNQRWFSQMNPKRICTYLKSDGRLTRQIAKGQRVVSREIRGMRLARYICCLFDDDLSGAGDPVVETNLQSPKMTCVIILRLL